MSLRHRFVPASDADAPESCLITSEDSERRRPDMKRLFAALVTENKSARGNEFVFRGDRNELWEMTSAFVDEESRCCPFYDYDLRETDDGVSLLVGTPAARVELQL
ncbi:MAG: hypothetical protein ABI559_08655 [Chloroflexota bacterium]